MMRMIRGHCKGLAFDALLWGSCSAEHLHYLQHWYHVQKEEIELLLDHTRLQLLGFLLHGTDAWLHGEHLSMDQWVGLEPCAQGWWWQLASCVPGRTSRPRFGCGGSVGCCTFLRYAA